jgi:NADPH:quinone reductase-like Zn-dependent oxidoreductase
LLRENGSSLSVRTFTSEKVENLVILKELVEADKIKAVIDRRYPIEKVAEAHSYVETGRKAGNVVVTVSG